MKAGPCALPAWRSVRQERRSISFGISKSCQSFFPICNHGHQAYGGNRPTSLDHYLEGHLGKEIRLKENPMDDKERILALVDTYQRDKGGAAGNAALGELLAASEDELGYLFFPPVKALWKPAAEILSKVGFPRLETRIPRLLEWFQDLNWPGIDTVIDLLRKAPQDRLLEQLESAASAAHAEEDEQWLGGLKRLALALGLEIEKFTGPVLAKALLKNDFY